MTLADHSHPIFTMLSVSCDDCDLPLVKEMTTVATADGKVTHEDCRIPEMLMESRWHWFIVEDNKEKKK